MHRSRIGVVLVDHPASSYRAAADFWAAARGAEGRHGGAATDEDPYESLPRIGGGIMLELQRLGTGEPRVHLDIESDDVPAEVVRLVGLGATVVVENDGWSVLTDPGGLVFCVVPVQTGADFDTNAVTWGDAEA